LLVNTIRNLRGLLTFTACTINTIVWFIPIFLLGIVKMLLPVAAIRALLSHWLMAFGDAWVSVNAVIFSLANDTTWDIRGADELRSDQWYLVIANHQTWVDIIVLQTAFSRRIPFLKFFIKQQLIWFPFLGVAFWALDMPFMKRYSKSYLARHPEKKGNDLEATRRACQKFRDAPTSVINFVEGTRFTTEKKASRSAPYEHLLMPRAGGVALALSSMGEMFDTILDVTIVYPGGPPAFWAMMCGEFDHVIVDIRQRPVKSWLISGSYEDDREFRKQFHSWLAVVWGEKDVLIGELLDSASRKPVC
jgi:1-acyl-sn-glycerol-3-phosphate acyltransferase